jgi:hypothetical protein
MGCMYNNVSDPVVTEGCSRPLHQRHHIGMAGQRSVKGGSETLSVRFQSMPFSPKTVAIAVTCLLVAVLLRALGKPRRGAAVKETSGRHSRPRGMQQ